MKSRLAFLALLGHAACAQPEDRSTDFTYLHAAIIEPSCATSLCHSASMRAGSLDLSTPEDACDALNMLPPAAIITLLNGEGTGDSPRMPLDVPLPPADIELLTRWLNDGAACE